MQIKPKARTQEILTRESGKELLIYDLTIDKAFLLNETCFLVWQECDGKKTIAEISRVLSQKTNNLINEEIVWLSLDVLRKEKLLERNEAVESKFNGMSRREVVRRIGLSSLIALPLITTLVAPTAAQTGSGASAAARSVFVPPVPLVVTAGDRFTVLLRIVDTMGNTVTSPNFFAFLTSSDPQAQLGLSGPTSSGERFFTNIELRTAGNRTLETNASGIALGDTRNITVNPGLFSFCSGGFPRDQFGNIIQPGPGVPVC